jgi:hypothetical protein
MNTLLNSWQDLEALLKELDQEMPPNVHFVGPYVGNASRICACFGDDGPSGRPPNPFEAIPGTACPARPFVVGVDLFMPTRAARGWSYTVHLVVDELLCSDEVRTKIHSACSILLAHSEKNTGSDPIECSVSGLARQPIARKKIRVN